VGENTRGRTGTSTRKVAYPRVGREVEKVEAGVADYGAWLIGGECESFGSRLRRRIKIDVYIVTIFN
jgi:hypothetical protein